MYEEKFIENATNTRLNDIYMSIEEAMVQAPLGSLTVVLDDGYAKFHIQPEHVEERREFREGECIQCAHGIATYEDVFTTDKVYATNGADITDELWLTLSDTYKELWIGLFNAGLLQFAILGDKDDPNTWKANPLDIVPVQVSENFTENPDEG
jgi:hypothetical protein